MGDLSSACTLKTSNAPQAGLRITIFETEATADDGDYVLMNSITGVTGVKTVLSAYATQDITGTGVLDAMEIDGTDKTKVVIGGSTDNKARTVTVFSV